MDVRVSNLFLDLVFHIMKIIEQTVFRGGIPLGVPVLLDL